MMMNGRITEQTKGTELDRATRTRRLKKHFQMFRIPACVGSLSSRNFEIITEPSGED